MNKLKSQKISLPTLFVLIALAARTLYLGIDYFNHPETLGNDSSSHIVASARFAQNILEGNLNLWIPDMNLGYAGIHFYQPFPHLITGLTALVLGGPEHAPIAYKVWLLILLSLIPISFYLGLRRLGLSPPVSCLGATLSCSIHASDGFGMTYASFLHAGLYPQLFGAFVFPFALSEGVQFIRGKGTLARASLWFFVLFMCHSFTAVATFPLYLIAAFFEFRSHRKRKKISLSPIKKFVYIGICFSLLSSFFIVPLLLCYEYFGGWPWKGALLDGWKPSFFIPKLLSGKLTDHMRLPVISTFSFLGIVAVFFNRRNFIHQFSVSFFLISAFFLCGRETFGSIVDWIYPANLFVPMWRYIIPLHFSMIFLCALGGDFLLRVSTDKWRGKTASALIFIGLATFSFHTDRNLKKMLQGQPEPKSYLNFLKSMRVLREAETPGRYYTHGQVGFGDHWHMYLPAIYSNKPGAQSYGTGQPESLSFYFLEHYDLRKPYLAEPLAELFNFRYFLVNGHWKKPKIPLKKIGEFGNHQIFKVKKSYGYFEIIDEPKILSEKTPLEARKSLTKWIWEEYPQNKFYTRLASPIGLKGFQKNPIPRKSEGNQAEPFGEIKMEKIESSSYQAKVHSSRGDNWLLLKVTAHPFWRAKIDNKEKDIFYLSPSFMGVPIPKGESTVQFYYQIPAFQKFLMALSVIFAFWLVLPKRNSKVFRSF